MYKLCRIDLERGGEIHKELKSLSRRIKKRFDARVGIYGSFARGDFNEGGDIDMIVIGDFEQDFKDRIYEILKMTDLPIEPLCYTKDEFERMKREGNVFIAVILEEMRWV